jgi:hypothetical protein
VGLDAVLIATDLYREVPGVGFRDRIRLSIEGEPATMEFLWAYFREGKDVEKLKRERRQRTPLPLNGPYLNQYLRGRGLRRERLLRLLCERPRTVVISTTFFPPFPQIEMIASFAEEHVPDTTVIAGGIQPWKPYRIRRLFEQRSITEDVR